MENQAHGLTTDSAVYKRFSPVKQTGFISMFKSSSVKRTACAIALPLLVFLPLLWEREFLSFLQYLVRQLFLKQRRLGPAAEPTDTKTAETVASKGFAFGCVR